MDFQVPSKLNHSVLPGFYDAASVKDMETIVLRHVASSDEKENSISCRVHIEGDFSRHIRSGERLKKEQVL